MIMFHFKPGTYTHTVVLKNGELAMISGTEMGTDAILQTLEAAGVLHPDWADDERTEMYVAPQEEPVSFVQRWLWLVIWLPVAYGIYRLIAG